MATFENEIIIDVSTNLQKVGKSIDKNLKKMQKTAEKTARSLQKVGASVRRVGSSMSNAGRSAFLPVTGAISALGIGALKQASNIESLQTAFEGLAGSAEKGNKIFDQLVQFSEATPFDPNTVANAGKSLVGFGVGVDDIADKLKFLGDLSAGSGKDLVELSAIFGKVVAKGIADTETFDMFAEAGINLAGALADIAKEESGISLDASEIRKGFSEGRFGVEEIEKALLRMTGAGGQYEDMMMKQSRTLGGLFSTLSGRIQLALADIGQSIKETFNLEEVIPQVGDKIRDLVDWFKNLDSESRKWIVVGTALVAIIPPLLIAFGAMVSAIGAVSTAFGVLTAIFIANPIGLVVTGVVALGIALWALVDDWDAVWSVIKQGLDSFSDFVFDTVNFIGNLLSGIWDGFLDKGMFAIEKVKGLFGGLMNKVQSGLNFLGFGDDSPAVTTPAGVSSKIEQNSRVKIDINANAPINKVQTDADKNTDIISTIGITNAGASL